jgi:hypothetical protein
MTSAWTITIYLSVKMFIAFTRKSLKIEKGIGLPTSLLFLSLNLFFVFFESYIIEQMYVRIFSSATSTLITVSGFIVGFEISEKLNYYLSKNKSVKKTTPKLSIDYFINSLMAVCFVVIVYLLIIFV